MSEVPPGREEIQNAWRDFESTLAGARAALDRRRAEPVHTPEQRQQLHDDARSGLLGRRMQELARLIDARQTSWGEVFEGTSPHTDLFAGHLDRMIEENRAVIAQAVEDDPDFDPRQPDPEV